MSKVKCRIALVVSGNGAWNAVGWSDSRSEQAMADAASDGIYHEDGQFGERLYWVTVEAEVPETVETNGEAEDA